MPEREPVQPRHSNDGLPTRRPAHDVIEDVATRLEDAMDTGDVHVILPGCILALRVIADLERKGIA